MTMALKPGELSLLRATQLIHAAASDVSGDPGACAPAALVREMAIKAVLWQAISLLPPGLPLVGVLPRRSGHLAALEDAEQELRRLPVGAYPAGIAALVADLCDLIADLKAGESS